MMSHLSALNSLSRQQMDQYLTFNGDPKGTAQADLKKQEMSKYFHLQLN